MLNISTRFMKKPCSCSDIQKDKCSVSINSNSFNFNNSFKTIGDEKSADNEKSSYRSIRTDES